MTAPEGIGRVLVTGAGGFIGQSLVRAIAADGVTVIAHLGPPGAAAVPVPTGIPCAYADIDDAASIFALAEGADTIIHLAGPPLVAGSFQDPAGYARSHCLGTAIVLDACMAHRICRLVYISSAEVYGRSEVQPVSEDAPLAPLSPYAAMKIAAENLIRTCGPRHALEAIVLRPFSVIGPQVAAHSVLGTILRQAFEGDVVAVQALEVVRDYVFIDDVTEAIRKALYAPVRGGFRTYNIGTGLGTSVGDMAAAVMRLLNKAPDVGLAGTRDRRKTADIPTLVADPRLAALELDWRPHIPLETALGLVIKETTRSAGMGWTCVS